METFPEHAFYHDKIRDCDKMEMKASHGCDSFEGLSRSIESSSSCWTGFINNKPFGFWGVAPISDGIGSPWFLGTDLMDESSITIAFRTRKYVDKFFESYDFLYNYVHEENKVSQRWLSWIGFYLDKPEPYGVKGDLFRRFMLKKEDWRLRNV